MQPPICGPSLSLSQVTSLPPYAIRHPSLPSSTSGHGIRELTLKFSSSAAGLIGDSSPLLGWISLSVDSIKGHNQVSSKGFLTTVPRIEAGNVVIQRGFYVDNCSVTASCSLCAIVCNEMFTERHRCPNVLCIVVMLMGYGVNWNCMSMDFKVLRLICASTGITGLICASTGITRLICASFRITRLIGKGTARGGPTRGKKDAWYQSLSFRLCRLTYDVSSCFCVLMAKTILATRQGSLVVVREMPPRRGARRDGRGGRGRGVGRVQPEMREQQQPVPPAPAPVPVVPQVVPDQLSAEAKHLRDFKKYNPTTFDGSLEDPTRAQLWLSSLETIFWYIKCPKDQKVQCAVFMLTDRGTALWETTERMLGGDVGQITWQQLKESFYAKFFSASLRDAKRQEFQNLEQNDMTVE
ncbi:gag-protease polyprotein [Cucumis melo var. makuwa]|uniref:Gag-protease polyprotein n=1 Tax=Cucumis melo var. makuwa TaxID=1194695 RepID=A0A5A7U8Q8_CUCMM|nr:gag-protease polyprotein [Cucumis melo var. makuwa]